MVSDSSYIPPILCFLQKLSQIFCKSQTLVGLSVDGTEEIHNAHRHDKAGNGTYARIRQRFVSSVESVGFSMWRKPMEVYIPVIFICWMSIAWEILIRIVWKYLIKKGEKLVLSVAPEIFLKIV